MCGKRRVEYGVLAHPALRQVEAPPGIKSLPYALWRKHRALTPDALGDALYGPS